MGSAITSITPVDYYGNVLGPAVTSIPNLSTYETAYDDVLSSSSGQNEAGVTNKMKLGQKLTLNVAWKGLKTAEVSTVLKAFRHEYMLVEYLDPEEGDMRSKVFCIGDRTSPLINVLTGLWDGVSFSLVEQGMTTYTLIPLAQAAATSEVNPPTITIT